MDKLTKQEALRLLSEEHAKIDFEIMAKYKGTYMPGRDGAYTQELREFHKKCFKPFSKIIEAYENNKPLTGEEVIKIASMWQDE